MRVATEANILAEIDTIQIEHVSFNIYELFSLVVVEKSLSRSNKEEQPYVLNLLSELGRTRREGSIEVQLDSLRLTNLCNARLNLQPSTKALKSPNVTSPITRMEENSQQKYSTRT